jgi:hypothetical protein
VVTSEIITTEKRNEAPSIINADWIPNKATTNPDSAGPMIRLNCIVVWLYELACIIFSGSTIRGIAAERAVLNADRLDAKEDFTEKLSEIDLRGVFNNIFRSFRITKYTHSLKFTRLIVNFLKDVEMLEKEITSDIKEDELSSEEISYQYFSIFTAPLQSSIEDDKE